VNRDQICPEKARVVSRHDGRRMTQNALQHNAVPARLKPLTDKSEAQDMRRHFCFDASLFRSALENFLHAPNRPQGRPKPCNPKRGDMLLGAHRSMQQILLQHAHQRWAHWNHSLAATFGVANKDQSRREVQISDIKVECFG
jgi:hypothetical protein